MLVVFCGCVAALAGGVLVAVVLGATVAAAVVLGWAVGLPRCSVGRSGSFSSGDEVAGGGVAVEVCELACDVSLPRVGRDDDAESEGDEFLSVGRPESSLDEVDDEAEGDEFFSVGRSVSSLDDLGALLADGGVELALDDSAPLP